MSRITNRGRVKKDRTAGAERYYAQVRREWAETQRKQQQAHGEMPGGLGAFFVVQPTPTMPPPDSQEEPCPPST